MRWYLNDLSLQGQYPTPAAFIDALSGLLKLRTRSPIIRDGLFCSRSFAECQVTFDRTCRSAIANYASHEVKGLILTWITTRGPFIEDDRLEEADDYFEFEGIDVTDQGLGEAARRLSAAEKAGAFSFVGGPINFERTPLSVQHGLAEQPLNFLDVPNVWTIDSFKSGAAEALADPQAWQKMIEMCRLRFDRLTIPDAIQIQLNANTFYPNAAKRVIELLAILQEYMTGRQASGLAGPRSMELHQQFFTGKRARFTDESDANKHEFATEMTFPDPEDESKTIFGTWHGKIQTPQFRIHFQWPVPTQQTLLKVLYIGPKITNPTSAIEKSSTRLRLMF